MGRPKLEPPITRECKHCHIEKDIDNFSQQNTNRKHMSWKSYRHVCKLCTSVQDKERHAKHFAEGLCYCGKKRSPESVSFCESCVHNRRKNAPKYLPQKRIRSIQSRLETKILVFKYYGGQCHCCGETTFEFLELDHIGGWGKSHRHENGIRYGGQALYRWIIKNGFPSGFQVLCGSCHSAISYWGYCPHQEPAKKHTPLNSAILTPVAEVTPLP